MGVISEAAQSRTQYEQTRELSRQRGRRELLQSAQAGADTALDLKDPRRGSPGHIRLHRDVLQSHAQACEERDAVARRVRKAAENENRGRLENSGLFTHLLTC